MRPLALLLCSVWMTAAASAPALASEEIESGGWERVDSRYCTVWIDPSVGAERVSRRVSVWWIRPQVKVSKEASLEEQLGAKCDTLFRKVEEILDMYPPGIHVSIRVARYRSQIESVHQAQYGFGTDANAIYVSENNTIYVSFSELSESVLAHEMAHAIIDHYFGVRPPRKVEEVLAMYTDEHLRD